MFIYERDFFSFRSLSSLVRKCQSRVPQQQRAQYRSRRCQTFYRVARNVAAHFHPFLAAIAVSVPCVPITKATKQPLENFIAYLLLSQSLARGMRMEPLFANVAFPKYPNRQRSIHQPEAIVHLVSVSSRGLASPLHPSEGRLDSSPPSKRRLHDIEE